MDEDDFWTLIDQARADSADPEGQARWLIQRLSDRRGGDIQRFNEHFQQAMIRAYRWDLWGVSSMVHGHEDQTGFVGFRAWLVSCGRESFDAALTDPDSLAPLIEPKVDGTPLTYVARDAYEASMGSELPTATLDLFAEPAGDPIQPSDLSTRFPKIAAALKV